MSRIINRNITKKPSNITLNFATHHQLLELRRFYQVEPSKFMTDFITRLINDAKLLDEFKVYLKEHPKKYPQKSVMGKSLPHTVLSLPAEIDTFIVNLAHQTYVFDSSPIYRAIISFFYEKEVQSFEEVYKLYEKQIEEIRSLLTKKGHEVIEITPIADKLNVVVKVKASDKIDNK